MGDDPRTDGAPAVTIAEGDAQRIRLQIEATRAELGDTVAALAVKTDVKQQARDRFEVAKQRARAKRDELLGRAKAANPNAADSVANASRSAAERARSHPLPVIAASAVVAGFALGRLTKR